MKEISSDSNPGFKELKGLIDKNRIRKKSGKFVVEGIKEINIAAKAGFELAEVYWSQQNTSLEKLKSDFSEITTTEIEFIELHSKLYQQVAIRTTGNNAIGVFKHNELLNRIPKAIENKGIYLIAEGVEKPGNLGAILRSCDAVGVTSLILCNPKIDVLHPQVIRNSLGAVFHVPIWVTNNEEGHAFLKKNGVTTYTTFMEDSRGIYDTSLDANMAFVVGTEHEGVSEFWRGKGQNINIPMNGVMDSLNVSVASALLLYEGFRQLQEK